MGECTPTSEIKTDARGFMFTHSLNVQAEPQGHCNPCGSCRLGLEDWSCLLDGGFVAAVFSPVAKRSRDRSRTGLKPPQASAGQHVREAWVPRSSTSNGTCSGRMMLDLFEGKRQRLIREGEGFPGNGPVFDLACSLRPGRQCDPATGAVRNLVQPSRSPQQHS